MWKINYQYCIKWTSNRIFQSWSLSELCFRLAVIGCWIESINNNWQGHKHRRWICDVFLWQENFIHIRYIQGNEQGEELSFRSCYFFIEVQPTKNHGESTFKYSHKKSFFYSCPWLYNYFFYQDVPFKDQSRYHQPSKSNQQSSVQ